MKLVFITTGYLPMPAIKGGAVNTLLQQYINSNKKNQITVYSIGNKENKNYSSQNIEYRYIHKTASYKIITTIIGILNLLPLVNIRRHYIRQIIKDIKQKNRINYYDYIILENTPKSIIYLHKHLGNKIILHLHNDYLNKKTKKGKQIIKKCKKIICVSRFIEKRVLEVLPTNKTVVLYNGINFNNFNSITNKNALKKKYKINENKTVILYVGRLLKQKGIFELIKAFEKLNNENLILLMVGNGSQKIIKKIKKYKNKNVILLNYIDNSKVFEIYSLADFCVVPSKCNEAFGMVVIEGLACNTKMIVSNDGAIPEIVKGQNSIIIDKNNLENEIYKTLSLETSKKINKNKNNIKLLEKFDIKTHINNFNKILEKIN